MFENIVGHKRIKEYLERALKEQRYGHAYLFAGSPCVGKFSTALEFACQIMGEKSRRDVYSFRHPDLIVLYPFLKKDIKLTDTYLNALSASLQEKTSKNGVVSDLFSFSGNETIPIDVVREVISAAGLKTYMALKRVVIVRNAEMMRKESANTFLKILEEPPKSTMFILTTDNINGVIPTIVSRCQILKFGFLTDEEIADYLVFKGRKRDDAVKCAYLMDGSINESLCTENVLSRDEVVKYFLNDDREALFRTLFKSHKKQDEKSSCMMFLKLIYKYLSDSMISGNSKFSLEETEKIMDEILNAERDLKLNFQTGYILNFIMDISHKKNEVKHVRQS
jgi:DNA polymerase-3 subunit delta'